MTPQCDICGDYESENTTVEAGYGACQDCIHRLIENEIERRGEREERRRFESYWSGGITPDDIDRQQLKDAGR